MILSFTVLSSEEDAPIVNETELFMRHEIESDNLKIASNLFDKLKVNNIDCFQVYSIVVTEKTNNKSD